MSDVINTALPAPALLLRGAAMMLPLLLAAAFAMILRAAERRDTLSRRLHAVVSAGQPRSRPARSLATQIVQGVARFGQAVAGTGLLSGKALDGIRHQLTAAGIRSANAVGVFLGAKILLAAGLPTLVILFTDASLGGALTRKLMIAGAALLGLLLPDWLLKMAHGRYVKALDRGIPDMLDMLVMCTESGISLEPTLVRVSSEIAVIHPEIAQELALTCGELQIMTDPRIAFTNLGGRTGLRGLHRLSSTLLQTIQYGTPLGPALRSLTAEMRQEMLTGFEERAGRLPALLTVVMILFILPSLFITVGGPAILQVMQQLRK